MYRVAVTRCASDQGGNIGVGKDNSGHVLGANLGGSMWCYA